MTSDAIALASGAALGLSGLLLVASRSLRHRERLRARLGALAASSRRRLVRVPVPLRPLPAMVAGAVVGSVPAGPAGAVVGAGTALALRLALEARRRESEREKAEEQLREGVAALASAARAGLSPRRALEEAIVHARPPFADVLGTALDRLTLGEPLASALEELPSALPVAEAALLRQALVLHAHAGGDLPALLDELSELISQRIEARGRVRALTAQGRASGAVLAVLPVAFVGLLSGTGGSGLGAFYRTGPGAALLLAGFALDALGFLWMRRIVRGGPR